MDNPSYAIGSASHRLDHPHHRPRRIHAFASASNVSSRTAVHWEAGGELYDALDADSGELGALYDVFFEEIWFRDEFFHGVGQNMLYISEVEMEPGWKDRNVDLAAVRRLCDTLGQGCELAVMVVEDPKEAERWVRMGFERSPAPEERGICHMPFAFTKPLVEDNYDGHFKVLPNLNPKQRRTVN